MILSGTDLNYFLAVCETGNLSRASERLGVVQPTLSQAIRRLEDAVGKKLFVRQKTGMALTRAGELLKDNAAALQQNWEQLLQKIAELDSTPSGSFSLGCHASVALYSLTTFLKQILAEEKVNLRLDHALSREITEKVISRKLDFGLVINPVAHPDLVLKKLCSDRVGFWRTANAPKETLIYDPELQQSQRLLRKNKRNFFRFVPSNNLEVIADLAAIGLGTAILPERVARRHKELKPASLAWHMDELFLIYRADQSKTAGFRHTVEAILNAKI